MHVHICKVIITSYYTTFIKFSIKTIVFFSKTYVKLLVWQFFINLILLRYFFAIHEFISFALLVFLK